MIFFRAWHFPANIVVQTSHLENSINIDYFGSEFEMATNQTKELFSIAPPSNFVSPGQMNSFQVIDGAYEWFLCIQTLPYIFLVKTALHSILWDACSCACSFKDLARSSIVGQASEGSRIFTASRTKQRSSQIVVFLGLPDPNFCLPSSPVIRRLQSFFCPKISDGVLFCNLPGTPSCSDSQKSVDSDQTFFEYFLFFVASSSSSQIQSHAFFCHVESIEKSNFLQTSVDFKKTYWRMSHLTQKFPKVGYSGSFELGTGLRIYLMHGQNRKK